MKKHKNRQVFCRPFTFIPGIKNYDWGSTSFIQKITGRNELLGEPAAELWMGSHKNGNSLVVIVDGTTNGMVDTMLFSEFIKSSPEAVLGEGCSKKYGNELPFLFKLLAAEKPLSIQVHPTKKEAEEGFAREETTGIPYNARERSYKDNNHKPELIYALTDFYLMKGFRLFDEICANLKNYCPSVFSLANIDSSVQAESAEVREDVVKKLFISLLDIEEEKLKPIIDNVLDTYRSINKEDITKSVLEKLFQDYKYQPGVIAPLFLNTFKLKSGDAMFLPAGEMHAYIKGAGFEVMANSDNVIRGGLTSKYVDKKELLQIASFKESSVLPLKPEQIGNEAAYPVEAQDFLFSVINLDEGEYQTNDENIALYFYYGRNCTVKWGDRKKTFITGESFIIPGCMEKINIIGSGTLYKTSIKT